LLPVSGQTAAWIFVSWNTGFSSLAFAAVCLEAWFQRPLIAPESYRPVVIVGAGAVTMIAGLMLFAAAYAGDELPLISEGRFTPANTTARSLAVALLCSSIAVIVLVIRGKSHLYLWLSLALTALLFHNILAGAGGGPFTVGWLVGRLSWVLSACVLFIYLLQRFSLQKRLPERTQGLPADAPEVPKSNASETCDLPGEVKTRLDTFVSAENIKRYKAMLDSEASEVHRQVLTTLLAEEEARLHRPNPGLVHSCMNTAH
jgi:hypothetical protein